MKSRHAKASPCHPQFFMGSGGQRISQARNHMKQIALRALLAICFMFVSCLLYSSTLNMDAIFSSEMSIVFGRTTFRCIPKDTSRLKVNLSLSQGWAVIFYLRSEGIGFETSKRSTCLGDSIRCDGLLNGAELIGGPAVITQN
jgi:hypothetical protein